VLLILNTAIYAQGNEMGQKGAIIYHRVKKGAYLFEGSSLDLKFKLTLTMLITSAKIFRLYCA
jgi:hypothetical protein